MVKLVRPRLKNIRPRLKHAQFVPIQTNYGNGRGGRPWRRKRARILKRDGYLCQCEACQAPGAIPRIADEVDHIVPIAEGGGDDDRNLRGINHACHLAKTQEEVARGRGRGGAKV